MIHLLEREQIIPCSLATAWKFFSNPANLSKITPPELDFVVKSKVPEEIYEGLMIEYRVRPLLGIALPWLTEITNVRAPYYFVDEQRVGPYSVWHHEHEFVETSGGELLIRDRVHYVLPFAPLLEFLHPLLVAPQLEKIFAYRVEAVSKLFGGASVF